MRLYRRGDDGEAVRDIQDRLAALGHNTEPDPVGSFGPGTFAAVSGFQKKRGLWTDGIVGPDTWRALVSAGFTLGSRILYHRVPMMRGDDVAELQRQLNSLGFDSGNVDGIFGPDTLRGLLEFQSNRGLAEDGLTGAEVVQELSLMARATAKPGREVVRDHQWLVNLPSSLAGQRIYVDTFCRDDAEAEATWAPGVLLSTIIQAHGAAVVLSRSSDTTPNERVRALRANRLGIDVVVSICAARDDGAGVFFFASELSSSQAGRALAELVAARLDIPHGGRAIPMLKNTRSPAVVVALDALSEPEMTAIAQGLVDLYATDWSERNGSEQPTGAD
ncbi:MAG: peptidoglycan-binding protein [Acidimicrobiia bacterium]|nr:peptidoglycan-binding protein [Acidimicrobiia bacterium]